jgi:DNA-binding CsgD family transcriptional regulator
MGTRKKDRPGRRLGAPRFRAADFARALRRGEFSQCHVLLEGRSPDTQLAASRLALREGRYVEVVGSLSSLTVENRRQGLERDVLLGAALGNTRDFVAGRKLLDRAVRQLHRADDPLAEDANYYKASIAWIEHEHRDAEETITPQLYSRDPNNRARAHILLSWVAVRRQNVALQIEELQKALDELDSASEPEEYYRAKALFTLALWCRERHLPGIIARVRSVYDAMSWTDGLKVEHFQVTRMLAWADALEGNELAAFRRFRLATSLAPSDHWQVLSLLDRASLAQQTGERAFALDLLYEAHELASGLQWSEVVNEERSALLVLATLFSEVEPHIAQQYLARFRNLTTQVQPTLAYGGDPRVRGLEAYSAGLTNMRLGNSADAQELLLEAWSIFEDFDFQWRASLCALNLSEITGDERWLERAANRISAWPRSWIARKVFAATTRRSLQPRNLPNAQRQVLELLSSGKRNSEIARALGRSPHTVRNQVAQLFKTYGVKTRAELVAVVSKTPEAFHTDC